MEMINNHERGGILMQKIAVKFMLVVFLLGGFVFPGCGEDNYNGDYTTLVSFSDAEQDDVMTLDMHQIADCNSDGVFDDPETFTDVFANITVTVDENFPGLTVRGYTIEYYPELSGDDPATQVLPPALASLTDQGSYNIYLPSGSTSTFTITCFSYDQKEDYFTQVQAAYPTLIVSRYTIRIILLCRDDNGQNKNLEIRRTVYFGFYDNC